MNRFYMFAAQLLRGIHCDRGMVDCVATETLIYTKLQQYIQEFDDPNPCQLMLLATESSAYAEAIAAGEPHTTLILELASVLVYRAYQSRCDLDESDPDFVECPTDTDGVHVFQLHHASDRDAEQAMCAAVEPSGGTVTFIDYDVFYEHVLYYAESYSRLDKEFHCRAWDEDIEWWSKPPSERGEVSPELVAKYYGEGLGRPATVTRQLTLTSQLALASSTM